MTRDEFIDGYLRRSGAEAGDPERWLKYRTADGYKVPCATGRVALPCYCGGPGCDGWAMVPDDPEDIQWHEMTDGRPSVDEEPT